MRVCDSRSPPPLRCTPPTARKLACAPLANSSIQRLSLAFPRAPPLCVSLHHLEQAETALPPVCHHGASTTTSRHGPPMGPPAPAGSVSVPPKSPRLSAPPQADSIGQWPSFRGHSTYRRGLPRRRPPQGRRTSPAMDRCAKGEGGVWVATQADSMRRPSNPSPAAAAWLAARRPPTPTPPAIVRSIGGTVGGRLVIESPSRSRLPRARAAALSTCVANLAATSQPLVASALDHRSPRKNGVSSYLVLKY